MPKYAYKCSDCTKEFVVKHSLKDKQTKCILCDSENALTRLPNTSYISIKPIEKEANVGDVTKRSIEDFGRDLKEEKQRLKERDYDGS